MTHFEGDRDFSHAADALFARLSDARFLVQCIPDVDSVTSQDADRATLILRPGFSFVRGTLELSLQVLDRMVPVSVRVLLHTKGIGSSSDVEATLSLSGQGGGTRVHWTVEIKNLGGLLKMVPSGLVRGAAQKVINDAWERVTAKLAEGT
jgi:carbon monoxide dehydrogenase subunit G